MRWACPPRAAHASGRANSARVSPSPSITVSVMFAAALAAPLALQVLDQALQLVFNPFDLPLKLVVAVALTGFGMTLRIALPGPRPVAVASVRVLPVRPIAVHLRPVEPAPARSMLGPAGPGERLIAARVGLLRRRPLRGAGALHLLTVRPG